MACPLGMTVDPDTIAVKNHLCRDPATWGHAILCCNTRWWFGMNGTKMGLRILSLYHCETQWGQQALLFADRLLWDGSWQFVQMSFSKTNCDSFVDELPWDTSWNSLVTQTGGCSSCPAGLRQFRRWTSWMWKTWPGKERHCLRMWGQTSGCTAKFSEMPWRWLIVKKWAFKTWATFAERSCCQHADCMLPRNLLPL